jgi:hypothetical protein
MNVVAISLYGRGAKYLVGAVENARLVKEYYPGWECHAWVKNDVPMKVCDELARRGAVVHSSVFPNGMFDRLLAHDLPGVERYIVRDVDSRIGLREVKAVEEWIKSGTQLHVMRDHFFHNQAITGGLWGWKPGPADFNMRALCQEMAQVERYGQDQDFLARHVWTRAETRTVHDSCGTFDNTRNWPSYGSGFAGEYVNEQGLPNIDHRRIRSNWLRKCEYEAKTRAMV